MVKHDYFKFFDRMLSRFGLVSLDNNVVVPSGIPECVSDAPHIGQPTDTKVMGA